MRTSIMLASALAATALAKPLEKREVIVTTVDIVYTTNIVTVTAGQAPSSAATVKPAGSSKHRKHGHKHPSGYPVPSNSAPAPYPVPSSSSSVAPAPAPSSSSSEAPAPAPVPTTSKTPAPAPTSYKPPAQSSTSSAAPAPAPTSYPGGVASTYQQAVVQHHNYHRANHSAPDIAWDQELADIAMQIAKTCNYKHQKDPAGKVEFGQNIAAGVGAGEIGETISDLFYNGEVTKFSQYGVADPSAGFEGWGHFSQIVWKSTQKVGCASWSCNAEGLTNFQGPCTGSGPCNAYFTVCNYSPPGNFGGEYAANIGEPLNKPTVQGKDNVDTSAIKKSYCGSTGQDEN